MNTITTLITDIQREHEAAFGKAREALEHARKAGELLNKAKGQVGHGAWLPWLEEHCKFSARTAQGYMRLASRRPELAAKCATVADLPLRDALAVLAGPECDSAGRRDGIAERLEALADDMVNDDDEDRLRARVAAVHGDAFAALDATDDLTTCARIAHAAGKLEAAAVGRRLHAQRMIGRLQLFDETIGAMLDAHPGASAFFGQGKYSGQHRLVFLLASTAHPGFWHFAALHTSAVEAENIVEHSKRPVSRDALPTLLASIPQIQAVEFQACDPDMLPVSMFWPQEVAA